MTTTITPSSTTNVAWAGLFDPAPEADTEVIEVEGRVPEGLAGTLYRVGPGDLTNADHLFDGDGYVAAVRLDPAEGVHLRTRYVRTVKRARGRKVAGFGTRAPGGVAANALRMPSPAMNAANTALLMSAGRLLALWEAGHPWQLDPDTLDTVGEIDFDGVLPARVPFSAHPHGDPRTGEVFNFGMVYGPRNAVTTWRLDRAGRLHPVARTPLPAAFVNHDFALTDRWTVFCFGPARARVLPLLLGRMAFGESLQFHPDEPTLVVLVPRDGGPAITIEAEPWFQFHFGGAFDDGDDVVVDLVRYDDFEGVNDHLRAFRDASFTGFSQRLWRYRIDTRARRVEGHEVTAVNMEFPQVDPRRATGGYDVTYGACVPDEGGLFTGIGRVRMSTGETDVWDFGAGRVVSEPLFVPRPGGEAEDDGWLLALVYDPDRRGTDAVVLDARRLDEGPSLVAHLPVHTGISFHGTWRPAAQTA